MAIDEITEKFCVLCESGDHTGKEHRKVPAIGSVWVWEIDKSWACELLEVVEVEWNGEEWWVTTRRLHDTLANSTYSTNLILREFNTLDRFLEATTHVRG